MKAGSHQVTRVYERPFWPRLLQRQQESAMARHNVHHVHRRDVRISDDLHPLVHMAIIGLVLLYVAAVWMFFDSNRHEAWLDAVVTGFFIAAIGIPALLWLTWRRNVGSANEHKNVS